MRTKNEIGSSDWFGEIPEGWETLPTKALFTTTKGMTVTKANLVEDGAPVVNYGQVHSKANSGFHLSDELVRYVPEDFVKAGLKKSTFGSFIFACTSEDMEGCGACVYNDSGIEVNPGGDTMLLSPKENGDNRFFAYLFSTDGWRWQFRRNLVDVKVFHVNQTDLKETYVVVPPLPEQERIADYLDAKCEAIDADVSKRRELVEKLKEYRKCIISHAVTRGLDGDAPMKDSGVEWIGEIPEGWETRSFQHLFSTSKGLSITKANLVEAGVPVISYGQIHAKTNTGVATHCDLLRFISPDDDALAASALTKPGDIVFADTSEDLEGCGAAFYIDREGVYGGYHTVIARPKTAETTRYVAYFFQSDAWRHQIRSRVHGIKVFSITQAILKGNCIPFPPLSEQQRIADYLDAKCAAIDAAIAKQEQLVAKLDEYRKSVIHAAVTGRIDLSQGA